MAEENAVWSVIVTFEGPHAARKAREVLRRAQSATYGAVGPGMPNIDWVAIQMQLGWRTETFVPEK